MLLQIASPKPPPKLLRSNQIHVSLPSNTSISASVSYGRRQNSIFSVEQSILCSSKGDKELAFIKCSSVSRVGRYGKVAYGSRSMVKWKAVFKKISMNEDQRSSAASILNQAEDGGKYFSKWEISRIVKELRKFKWYKLALEVFEWMSNRMDKYRISTSDKAIELDLISKVYGVSSAEQYFKKLPDALKDKRIFGALLNVYAQAKMVENAESLMSELRERGFAIHPLPFNVMMTLYVNLEDHEKVDQLISEMKAKKVELDIYSYNIWLSSSGSQGSAEKMERAFKLMQQDTAVSPNWTTFSTMATMYMKLEEYEKAENCLRQVEGKIIGPYRLPYHYLISLYASAGNKDEVYRVWNTYKATFVKILNSGYHSMVSALVRLDDIDGAETIYDEWLSAKSVYDPKVGNLLLGVYVQKGLSVKAQTFFDQMIEMGGKPNAMTWEFIAEDHIRKGKIPVALSCLKKASLAHGSKRWKPKPATISSILKVSEQEADTGSKVALLQIMRQVRCFDDEVYMSHIPVSAGADITEMDADVDGAHELLSQLQESF